MKAYILSGLVGLVVGALYGVLGVKSPAPPVVALVGLLGMLGGEQAGAWLATWHNHASAKTASPVPPGTADQARVPGNGDNIP